MNTTNISKDWVLDFTGLERDENFIAFSVEKGVLHVELVELNMYTFYKADFILKSTAEVKGFRTAKLEFCLPLPECITSDGIADFNALCDEAAGPDEIVFWDERIAVDEQLRSNAAHYRNLMSAGDH